MATVAVFVALGGSSYAALRLPKDSIGARELKPNSIGSKEIRKSAVRSSDVKNNALAGTDIDESSLDRVPLSTRSFRADLADTSLRSDSAANAGLLEGRSARDLELRCATETLAFGSGCFETAQRSATDFETAADDCADSNRRLPSTGDLVGAGRDPAFSWSDSEWADDLTAVNSAVVVSDGGGLGLSDTAASHPYRCVASRTNARS
jgi:hypothetical protein